MMYGMENEELKEVRVEKIDNGFVIRACGVGKEQAEFIKNISKAPGVLSRMFKITKEDRKAIAEGTDVETSEKESGEGLVDLDITITR